MTAISRFERTPDWLLAHARGQFDIDWFKAFILEIASTAKAAVPPPPAILIDARELTGARIDNFDRYDIGVLAARETVGVPVAFVATEPLIDPRRFGEMVARNRGINVRAFTDLDKAMSWLRAESGGGDP